MTGKLKEGGAFLVYATMCMLSTTKSTHCYVSAFHEQELKNQSQARASPKAEDGKKADQCEIKKLGDIETWHVVDTMEDCNPPLPGM